MSMSLLPRTFFPRHEENRMKSEGDVARARDFFLARRPSNLSFLLEQRYGWMNEYLEGRKTVIELGSGAGFSREFIRNPNLKLTDVANHPWIDMHVDAMSLPFEPGSVDAIICSHMIHHVARPKLFFEQAMRVLAPGGVILISEIETSLMTRALLRLMRHEGWSYDCKVFDISTVANDPVDPWSANCAIPELLFTEPARFEAEVGGLKVARNELTECLVFPLSGGVIAKSRTVNLPRALLKLVHRLDQVLIGVAPRVFAMGRRVVLRKGA